MRANMNAVPAHDRRHPAPARADPQGAEGTRHAARRQAASPKPACAAPMAAPAMPTSPRTSSASSARRRSAIRSCPTRRGSRTACSGSSRSRDWTPKQRQWLIRIGRALEGAAGRRSRNPLRPAVRAGRRLRRGRPRVRSRARRRAQGPERRHLGQRHGRMTRDRTMNPSADLVNKLWRLCALLRKDGVTYQQYVTELTYLLFLKMASEQKDESRIPEQYRWGALKSASETEVLHALPAGADRSRRRHQDRRPLGRRHLPERRHHRPRAGQPAQADRRDRRPALVQRGARRLRRRL